jgi:hypothetical protein
MSVDSITPVSSVPATPRPQDQSVTPAAASPAGASADSRMAYPNPDSRLDPELHMVILEYRDSSGHITSSLPTAQALERFRLNLTNPAAATAQTPSSGTPDEGATLGQYF